MGLGAGPSPRHARWLQKYLGRFPKMRRLRRQVINLTPQKKVKAWGRPPEARRIDHPADKQSAEKPLYEAGADHVIFDERPTRRKSVAQGLFRLVRTQGHGPDASGGSKNASGPSEFPWREVPYSSKES